MIRYMFISFYCHFKSINIIHCLWKFLKQWNERHSLHYWFTNLNESLTVHHGSGSPLPGVSHRLSLEKPACRWPGHHHWIAGWITTEADPLEDQHGRKGTSGQHEQNQGPDIWAEARRASDFRQRPLLRVSQGRRHKFHFLWWLFPLDPHEMQWHPWLSEVWCQFQV